MEPKSILITGASSGIGKAIAQKCAEQGHKLILCARRKLLLDELSEQLKKQYSVSVDVIELDVSNLKQVENTLSEIPQVDVLINNAGNAHGLDTLEESSTQDIEQMLDINVKGLIYVTRAILKKMRAQNSGHIINIGSVAGREVYPKGLVYCASKHAVRALTHGLKKEVHSTPIRVSSVDPGLVQTEFAKVRFKGDEDQASKVYQGMTPLQPEDIADSVYFVLSRPAHVNIQEMLVLPTDQSSAQLVHRKETS